MKFETAIMRKLFQEAIRKLENEGVDTIEIDQDYYYSVSSETRFAVGSGLDADSIVESLEDGWLELLRVSDGKQPMTYVDFTRLAGVLIAISDIQAPAS